MGTWPHHRQDQHQHQSHNDDYATGVEKICRFRMSSFISLKISLSLLCLIAVSELGLAVCHKNQEKVSHHHEHHRTKRFLWLSHDRRLILPPGSTLVITPRLQVPFLRQPPEGLNSDIQISWPFYMFFDKLGMTGDTHPWPPTLPFRLGELFSPVREGLFTRKMEENMIRRRRAVLSLPPPENIHGGERAVILPRLEKILSAMGLEGRACLLRAICEVHEYPLHEGYGLFGEILTLFFSISSSPYAQTHLPEYLKAEKAGKGRDCSAYSIICSKSMFGWEEKSKYSREMQNIFHSDSTKFKENDDENEDFTSTSTANDMESYMTG